MALRVTLIAAMGGLVLGVALLGAIALHAWSGEPAAGAGDAPGGSLALRPATPLPITPTTPFTLALHPEWYPTSAPFHVSPPVLARHIAFAPASLDVAFTVNRAAEGDARDLFLASAGPDGAPSGAWRPLLGLPDGAGALVVKSSNAAGMYAVGAFDEAVPAQGGRFASVWLASTDGGSVERLDGAPDGVEDLWWLPDGSALALLYPDGRLVVRDLSDRGETVVASGLIGPTGRAAVLLSWSPDGRHAALGSTDRGDASATLELLDAATGERTLLADFDVRGTALPLFGLDGATVFAFVADGDRPGAAALYSVDPLAPGAHRLLADLSTASDAPASIGSAVASPVTQHLYFVQNGAIHRIGTDGARRATIVGRGSEVVRGDLVLQTLEGGVARLGYLASAYLGPSQVGSATGQVVTTAFAVRSVDISAP